MGRAAGRGLRCRKWPGSEGAAPLRQALALWLEAVGREARVAGGDHRPQSTVVVLGCWGWGDGGGSGGSHAPVTCQQMALTERETEPF